MGLSRVMDYVSGKADINSTKGTEKKEIQSENGLNNRKEKMEFCDCSPPRVMCMSCCVQSSSRRGSNPFPSLKLTWPESLRGFVYLLEMQLTSCYMRSHTRLFYQVVTFAIMLWTVIVSTSSLVPPRSPFSAEVVANHRNHTICQRFPSIRIRMLRLVLTSDKQLLTFFHFNLMLSGRCQ